MAIPIRRPGFPRRSALRGRGRIAGGCLLAAGLWTMGGAAEGLEAQEDPERERRLTMVERQIESRGIDDPSVLRAMRAVPRHQFVLPEWADEAYSDSALPINEGQTISQPYIVAFMTEQLDIEPGDRVLEVGTGSGYQAAVLGEMDAEVYTIEIFPALAEEASERLAGLGYTNVTVRQGDGYLGWPEHAPFDAIVVTAAPESIPPPLIEQLAPGGVMVIPVGPVEDVQELTVVRKLENGSIQSESVLPVRFVPFLREEAR